MSEITDRLRKQAQCIYLAADECVAKDISKSLLEAADLIEAQQRRIAELEADNKAAWATNRAIDKARMEEMAKRDAAEAEAKKWQEIADKYETRYFGAL